MPQANPLIIENAFCVLVPKSATGSLTEEGFSIVGPFATTDLAKEWAEIHITNTPYDNPHWVVVPMAQISTKWGVPMMVSDKPGQHLHA